MYLKVVDEELFPNGNMAELARHLGLNRQPGVARGRGHRPGQPHGADDQPARRDRGRSRGRGQVFQPRDAVRRRPGRPRGAKGRAAARRVENPPPAARFTSESENSDSDNEVFSY